MFWDIPRKVSGHSPEYNIPPIPRVPRIPFPVPVFLVLYIAIKDNTDELIYEAIETISGKKYKIPNEFSICNHLNVNTDKNKDFIEYRIRYQLENGKLKNKSNNGVNSYFKTIQLILLL